MNQGWFLVLLTSLTTLCGCCVIYADVLYKFFFPKRFAKHPFHIANNTKFLVCSLGLSAGCLSFVSLYKLLPNSVKYLKQVDSLGKNHHLLKATAFACYASGIACCSLLNLIVHLFTSESIVHCVHEGPDGHKHVHQEEEHEHDPEIVHQSSKKALNETQGGSMGSSSGDTGDTGDTDLSDSAAKADYSVVAGPDTVLEEENEEAPFLGKPSVVDLSLKALKGEQIEGECYGDMECCCERIASEHHLHKHHDPNNLHFCCFPSEENQIFFKENDGEMVTNRDELEERFPELDINSPLMKPNHTHYAYSSVDEEPDHTLDTLNRTQSHTSHFSHMSHVHEGEEGYEHHHHHIKTPLARLLSIGLQTTLAITMHKLPEGFVIYATSEADSRLGWTIFLSMFVHNFVEGFTMTVPIYLALGSRWKAIIISGGLGCMAQPIGATIGYFVFRTRGFDMKNQFSLTAIGTLIALTAGFLSYIALQMLTSAVAFGGRQETVMRWTIAGILLIFFSNILI